MPLPPCDVLLWEAWQGQEAVIVALVALWQGKPASILHRSIHPVSQRLSAGQAGRLAHRHYLWPEATFTGSVRVITRTAARRRLLEGQKRQELIRAD